MTPQSAADVIALRATGARVRYLYFWGHRPEPDGSLGRGCLSQWWPVGFTADGQTFASAEHYMMWRKAVLFRDAAAAAKILEAEHPAQAKAFGREVRGFDEGVWRQHRADIVLAASLAKFGQHDDLRAYLIGTGERVLVEASPLDAVWGIGVAADDRRAGDPAAWPGLNLLGFALMHARTTLRETPTL
ncbi:NADAR family protein [Catellatospora sp. KI3]|uniref:NADAR family protein n=1 Tax=Catellatospora sp. KI3 TaxID=3041620 RepID=UPI00248230C7|nr:NADAR family protein [Catellatospora sp. KI3]MDI1462118.1 NADAR family protein [Catellatospora sp. KI3]